MESNPLDKDSSEMGGDETVSSDPGATISQIGKYKISRKIGQGGMGEVWLGHHPDLDIPVAIKTLPTFLVSKNKGYLDRFIKEARTAARINHPNVVRIYDAGIDDDVNYIVMEFVDGGSVKELMKKGGVLDWKKGLDITICIAEALKAAGEFNIIHRDIKPENIILDKKGTPKLADLGLAKQTESPDDLSVTAPGSAIGTPNYISPEQVQDAKTVDCRADIYSLGATFYHMATGGVPFSASSSFELMLKHVQAPLPPPKEKNPELPDNICAIICKMMAKRPDDRYQTPEELLQDLYKVKHGNPPLKHLLAGGLQPGATIPDAGPQAGRKALIAAAVLVICLGFLAAGIKFWPHQRSTPDPEPDGHEKIVVVAPDNSEAAEAGRKAEEATKKLENTEAAAKAADEHAKAEAEKATAALQAAQAEAGRRQEAKKRAEEEAAEALAARNAAEEKIDTPESRKRAEEAARLEAAARARAETARKAEEEAKRKAEEEAERLAAEKARAAEEARRIEEARKRAKAEALLARQKAQEARRRAEEEAKRKELERKRIAAAEAKRREEERQRLAAAKAEAKHKAEAEAEAKRREEERQRLAAAKAEAKHKAEAEAKALAEQNSQAVMHKPEQGEPHVVPELKIPLAPIKAGTFKMGSRSTEWGRNAGEIRHSVTITAGFWIGRHEITVGQFHAITNTNPEPDRDETPGENVNRNRLPAAPVTWKQAMEFCEALTQRERAAGRLPQGYVYRLPTEAEWEYACRAGGSGAYSFGNTNFLLSKYAVYRQRGVEGPAEVGSKKPNKWGLYDMHGNVFEWCLDAVENQRGVVSTKTYKDGVRDPLAAGGRFRISRGGSWRSSITDCRAAARFAHQPGRAQPDQGFRVVLATAVKQ